MIEQIDLGVCRGYRWHPGGDGVAAERVAVVLPGRMLGGTPAVSVAIAALLDGAAGDRGWGAVQVWDEFLGPPGEATAWVTARADAALEAAGGTARLLIAKSLSTRAAGLAAEHELPAIWLTPLLNDPECVELLRRRTAPALLVGGTADPAWNGDLAHELSDQVLELEDADHGLGGRNGVASLLENLGRLAAATASFAGCL